MARREQHRDQVVHVRGEATEAALVAHEAVHVDQQQLAPAVARGALLGRERVRRREARVLLHGRCDLQVGAGSRRAIDGAIVWWAQCG